VLSMRCRGYQDMYMTTELPSSALSDTIATTTFRETQATLTYHPSGSSNLAVSVPTRLILPSSRQKPCFTNRSTGSR
jgi:hypothetical protein